MTDDELLRYSRHILLEEIGTEGQARIRAAHAVIVGAGGLGSPAAFYLASAGVGRLTLIDGDRVDLTNLQRQILHTTDRIGVNKAVSGKRALEAINPQVDIAAVEQRVAEEALDGLLRSASVVLDCCDNFATRHAINRCCVRHGVPLVSGAAVRFDGQLIVFDRRVENCPCYACLFPEGDAQDELCAVMGVFAPLTGIIGTLQAAEALKLLIGAAPSRNGELLLFDGLSSQFRVVRFARHPECSVCSRVIA